jgi:hypothetical protein
MKTRRNFPSAWGCGTEQSGHSRICASQFRALLPTDAWKRIYSSAARSVSANGRRSLDILTTTATPYCVPLCTRVASVDAHSDLLTVLRVDGSERKYDPRRHTGVSVYRDEQRAFSVGDRVQFTAPNQNRRSQTASSEQSRASMRTEGWQYGSIAGENFASIPRAIRIRITVMLSPAIPDKGRPPSVF